MKIKFICILVFSVTGYLHALASEDFGKIFAKFAARKTVDSKPKVAFSDVWLSDDCSVSKPCEHSDTTAYLVFTVSDMNKNGECPDTCFNKIYSERKFSIQAWKMPESKEPQQEISLLFGLPDDCDSSKPLTITLYLLAQGKEKDATTANLEISIDSKIQGQELGPHFLLRVSTGNFLVIEPSDHNALSVLTVQATIPPSLVKPKGLLVLVMDRIAPTGGVKEYSRNLYLESVVLAYQKK